MSDCHDLCVDGTKFIVPQGCDWIYSPLFFAWKVVCVNLMAVVEMRSGMGIILTPIDRKRECDIRSKSIAVFLAISPGRAPISPLHSSSTLPSSPPCVSFMSYSSIPSFPSFPSLRLLLSTVRATLFELKKGRN